MVLEFEFPDTGEGVTEGKFLEWLVEEGEEIEEDQTVAEVETDKAVVDVPSPSDGMIKELEASPGDTVEVGDVIMTMEEGASSPEEQQEDGETEAEDSGEEEKEEADTEEREDEKEDAGKEKEEVSQASSGDILALPKVRKLAEEKGVDLASIKTGERITEEEVLEAAKGEVVKEAEKEGEGQEVEPEEQVVEKNETDGKAETPEGVKATPSVRKLAREKGVDLGKIEGSGRGGKIARNDVLEAAEGPHEKGKEKEPEKRTSTETSTESSGSREERVEMSEIRKTVAEKMEESRFTAPHVTHVDKADITELVKVREEERDKVDAHLTYLPFIVKAVCLAMEEHPDLNAELDEENDEIIMKKHYDFNIAVDTDQGLMVPVVEEIDEKNIVEIAEDINEKAEKAKKGELSSEEMRNGTFSITNLGVIGGEEFTPIINYPQAGILGVGKIQETAEVVKGEVEPRHTVKLSLSYDHRIVDGADAARFMNEVIENLEDPEHMLIEL